MEWGRVKSILIGVFVVVNIFLLFYYMGGIKTGVKVDNQTVSNATKVLLNNNIVIDENLIPRVVDDIRLFDIVNKFSIPKDVVSEIYLDSQKHGLDYLNPSRTTFDANSFIYLSNEFPTNIKKFNEKNAKIFAESEMKKIGLLKYKDYKAVTTLNDNNYMVEFSPFYNGKKIFDTNLEVLVSQNGIVKIKGDNWLLDTITDGVMVTSKALPEILINFATSKERNTSAITIKNVEIGYFVGNRFNSNATVSATPVWKIVTDQGSIYYFDSRNGDLL